MDEWQKEVYEKIVKFVNDHSIDSNHGDLAISINIQEAYVVMKAFEDQQRLLNPLLTVEESKVCLTPL